MTSPGDYARENEARAGWGKLKMLARKFVSNFKMQYQGVPWKDIPSREREIDALASGVDVLIDEWIAFEKTVRWYQEQHNWLAEQRYKEMQRCADICADQQKTFMDGFEDGKQEALSSNAQLQ